MESKRRATQADRKGFSGRIKKRKWHGKTKNTAASEKPSEDTRKSTSFKKIRRSDEAGSSGGPAEKLHNGYRLVHLETLFDFISEELSCKVCNGAVTLTESSVRGLGAKWDLTCESCTKTRSVSTSLMIGKNANVYEVNRRAALAMRVVGKGAAPLEKFCAVMDLPPPVHGPTYEKIKDEMLSATKAVAEDSMLAAARYEEELTKGPEQTEDSSDSISDVVVSGDGSWRKRGFTSLHGVCSVIGAESGKVIDVEVLSRFCMRCEKWKGKQDTQEYKEWFEKHEQKCEANYQGSAGGMEVEGMRRIFARSEETRKLRYTKYIGDGDTKTFSALTEQKPYGDDVQLQKIECVGHVQKRLGRRLRNLKKELGKTKLEDGKGIGGKGRLTDPVIDLMSQYYGMAIRNNCHSVADMQRAVKAIWHHMASSDEHPQHEYCPEDSETWCKWQKAKAEGQGVQAQEQPPSSSHDAYQESI